MKALLISIGITVVLFALILIGLFTGNATLASLSCLIGWSPAMIALGWSFRGAGLRVTVSSNPEPVTHDSPAPIQRRPRSIGMQQ